MSETPRGSQVAHKMAVLVVVVLVFAGLLSIVMPSLKQAKLMSQKARMRSEDREAYYDKATDSPPAAPRAGGGEVAGLPGVLAHVKSFVADITLTPQLSIGTERPQSIYTAAFHAEIAAAPPEGQAGDSQVRLPLPPQMISLSDLQVTVNGEPSPDVRPEGEELVWWGRLPAEGPTTLDVTYTAVGKGVYTLTPPPGRIIERFEATVTAHQSDVRMLELSLQPDPPKREGGGIVYHWDYERLMFGRPIQLDVLGIAPEDRLGELVWLGPLSVPAFGLLVVLVALAFRPALLDKWMLLLLVGAFAGAYPLMYFAQDFLSLPAAVLGASALVLLIIAARSLTLFGVRLGLFGPVLLAAGVLALTLCAAVWTRWQGVVLTVMAIGTLAVAMTLVPRAQKNLAALEPQSVGPPSPAPEASRNDRDSGPADPS